MAIESGFFNSVNGDRLYNAEDMGRYLGKLVSSGVYPNPSTSLQVLTGTGMQVQVQPGYAMLESHWLNSDSIINISIPAADVTLYRYDAIIMKLDLVQRRCTIELKQGNASSFPVVPDMTRSETVMEWCLAKVFVEPKTTTVTQSKITDTRADTKICGWITGLVNQVDTAALFTQWQTAYEEFYENFKGWFNTLTDDLRVDTYIEKRVARNQTLGLPPTTQTSTNINVEYDKTKDILLLFVNGKYFAEERDYTTNIRANGWTDILFKEPLTVPNTFDAIILSSKVGVQ